MPKFMKMLNNISRSQAIYRNSRICVDDLQPNHYAFVLAICRESGRSQEELARELCVNKSTVARCIGQLEENGYVTRHSLPCDKRQFSVYPTDKMMQVRPAVQKASREWMELLSEGISPEELEIFDSVLMRMQEKAGRIIEMQEDMK